MPGPAPKFPEQRVNRSAKLRGEWVSLPPLDRTYLPDLKADYCDETKSLWAGMQADPVTQLFGESEFAQCQMLARLHDMACGGKSTAWPEVRQWMDRLGFSMKGKRDLRFRVEEPQRDKPKLAKVSAPDFKKR